MFVVLTSWPKSLREFTRFIWWMQTEHRVAANPQTKPVDLGYESAENWQLPSTSTIHHRHSYYYSARKLILIYRPTEGGRLSRPRHCSENAQPVPKAAYRSGCRDKHNRPRCGSNLGPLTPQSDALTTRPLRPDTWYTSESINLRWSLEGAELSRQSRVISGHSTQLCLKQTIYNRKRV